MLCERSEGRWETAPMEKPYGRGVMFQVYISSIDPIIDRLKDLQVPIYAGPREVWRRYGDREGGTRGYGSGTARCFGAFNVVRVQGQHALEVFLVRSVDHSRAKRRQYD
jgi:hypothetical protein